MRPRTGRSRIRSVLSLEAMIQLFNVWSEERGDSKSVKSEWHPGGVSLRCDPDVMSVLAWCYLRGGSQV